MSAEILSSAMCLQAQRTDASRTRISRAVITFWADRALWSIRNNFVYWAKQRIAGFPAVRCFYMRSFLCSKTLWSRPSAVVFRTLYSCVRANTNVVFLFARKLWNSGLVGLVVCYSHFLCTCELRVGSILNLISSSRAFLRPINEESFWLSRKLLYLLLCRIYLERLCDSACVRAFSCNFYSSSAYALVAGVWNCVVSAIFQRFAVVFNSNALRDIFARVWLVWDAWNCGFLEVIFYTVSFWDSACVVSFARDSYLCSADFDIVAVRYCVIGILFSKSFHRLLQ